MPIKSVPFSSLRLPLGACRKPFLTALLALLSPPLAAKDHLALGLALASADNEYRERDDPLLLPNLDISLGNFFFDGGEAGYHVFGEEQGENYWTLAAIGQVRMQHFRASDAPQLAGMARRDASLEIGPAFSVGGRWGTAGVQITQDVLGRSGGGGGKLFYAYELSASAWTLTPYVDLERMDRRAANYYYGVKPGEATAQRPAYRLRDGRQWSIGYELAYRLGEHWQLRHSWARVGLEGDAEASPLVRNAQYSTASLGVSYAF